LGTVLFPGLVLPLHVFEERYRQLVQDLLALPEEQQRFGVLCIREGREVGADGVRALYDVGCTARLSQVRRSPDGRYDLVTLGSELFRLERLHTPDETGRPYLTGSVEWLADARGDEAQLTTLDPVVRAAFTGYAEQLARTSGATVQLPELPDDPQVLGHLVGATMALDVADRQALLEQPDAVARLRRGLSLLRREAGVLRALSAVPAPELARSVASPN
jgi:Lon protease-like protein